MSSPSSSFPPSLLDPFLSTLQSPATAESTRNDQPNYYSHDPSTLKTTCEIKDFAISTGASLYSHSIQPVLLSTQHSLTIVTCFWARSDSLETLNHVLRTLSLRALSATNGAATNGSGSTKIRVRICFSSLSITQKLFHTRSLAGKRWPPSTWVSKLGLPPADELKGLDLEIKSIFVLPFSVMHPKFIIVDGRTVLLPSCNVSWEDWCEGCVQLSGEIVDQFVRFHRAFWAADDIDAADPTTGSTGTGTGAATGTGTATTEHAKVPALFLPSPHHANPNFSLLPFPFLASHPPPPPATPLNTFILTALAHATSSVVMTTPNLTSPPLISAVLGAVRAGVDVTIYTSARMMLAEQLVTAGTITEWCVWWLGRKYRKLQQQQSSHDGDGNAGGSRNISSRIRQWSRKGKNKKKTSDIEQQQQQLPMEAEPQSTHPHDGNEDQTTRATRPRPQSRNRRLGQLQVFYFAPAPAPTNPSQSPAAEIIDKPPRADKLHFKSTIIDNHTVVLGSGNMDRASWYTSQELGVAIADPTFAGQVERQFCDFLSLNGGAAGRLPRDDGLHQAQAQAQNLEQGQAQGQAGAMQVRRVI